MKTTTLTPKDIKREWHLIDLSEEVLGRSAVKIANLISGKHKILTGAHLDNGDFVIAINSEKIKVTGNKLADKMYYSHSGFPGGFREVSLAQLMEKDSRRVIEKAVKGMLPKTRLGRRQLVKLRIYAGATHPHLAQQPTVFVDPCQPRYFRKRQIGVRCRLWS